MPMEDRHGARISFGEVHEGAAEVTGCRTSGLELMQHPCHAPNLTSQQKGAN